MSNETHRAGHVAVIGRPNVGKSTLVNALVGANLSIVSNRPQTTRHRLLGIATVPGGQIVLVDTPGLHRDDGKRASTALNRVLNRAARGAIEGVDAAALVVEAGRWDDEDTLAYDTLRASGLPVVLVVNQVDRVADKSSLLPYLQRVNEGREFAAVHPVSALKRQGLEPLVASLLAQLPVQPALYGEDELTDRSQRFLAGELVREQLMRQLGAELPYATTVEIESFTEEPSPKAGVMYRIGAVIWVEREGQKAIVIGKGGTRLRDIGKRARERMEQLFDAKVFLQTWVRVREGWSDDESALRSLGYGD
ncbi:GTPase Era [Luteimonas viscosa]|uniref:GTPase Era n=1 Tax=Luteimonas viscosa TaxID=1132694 RepID=A0A5D4XLP5_9GAMM|nr:GTPase Era [Luteimonas viscosa]TYT25597.1 GTPase Era [Luteimonas viscosa]